MAKAGQRQCDEILIETGADRYRAVLVRQGRAFDLMSLPRHADHATGDICLGRVVRRLKNLDAAFVEIGLDRPAFLDGAGAVEGAVLTVQVVDDAADKAVRVTTRLALGGRYTVLLPGDAGVAVSCRLDKETRARLNGVGRSLIQSGEGVIMRAAAANAPEEEIAADLGALRRAWDEAKETRATTPPAWLYREQPVRRILCAFATTPKAMIVVDDADTFAGARDLANRMSGSLADRIELARDGALFDRYGIADDLAAAAQPDVILPSRGRMKIEQTAALVTVDIDTATAMTGSAALTANLEAAAEIGRQLRLRELGGPIVVDFIRMGRRDERDRVLQALSTAVAPDRRQVDILGWTKGGLVELIRARSDRP